MGVAEGRKVEGDGLGCEASGVVRRTGPGVKHLAPGDRVIIGTTGAHATTLVVSEKLCAKMPDRLSFVEGGGMPCVYATVIRSLLDVARIKRDDTVLVHCACGGVGLAAIQICRMVGAEVFCTVGTQEKVEYLMETFDIPRNRIFSSRDISFLPGIMRETSNRGVDVVLNSLSGELLHGSWKCVADFGIMVEIGRRDIAGRGHLAMDIFDHNRSFVCVNFAQLSIDRPSIAAE